MSKKVLFKKRIKTDTGRVYIHGQRLRDTKFTVGAKYNIYFGQDGLALVFSKTGKYKVSKRTSISNNGDIIETPVLDLKSSKIRNIFKNYQIQLVIYEDCIKVRKTRIKASKVFDFISFKKQKENISINLDKNLNNVYMKMAAGRFESLQLSLFDSIDSIINTNSSITTKDNRILNKITSKMPTVASFFSGMGGLDYAFKKLGYDIIFALDKSFHKDTTENRNKYGKENCSSLEDFHIQTYKKNIGEHIVSADFLDYPIENIPDFEVGLFGILCVELSSVSPNRNKFNMLPKFIDRFIDIIKAKANTCKVFVIENSINLLKAGREFLDKIKKELPSFEISETPTDAADFGGGQHRERAIIIGSTIGKINFEAPKIKPIKTVRQCFKGLNDNIPNQLDYSIPREDTIERIKYIKQGHNWQDVPEHLRSKGKFANYMRRLSLDEISIAIANIRKSLILHPTENRILSVRECLRLFGLPDSFEVFGTLAAKQQMVANSVVYEVAYAIAVVIKKAYKLFLSKTEALS